MIVKKNPDPVNRNVRQFSFRAMVEMIFWRGSFLPRMVQGAILM